jgi:acetyl-CoA carboxylase biotin carboxyl carrier protein
MSTEQVKELMVLLEESKLAKLVFKRGDFELQLEKEPTHTVPIKTKVQSADIESAFQSEVALKGGIVRTEAPGNYVTSPMVGTFYAASAPDQPAFVKVGDKVTENTVVCIIEAMKVMNEVKAGVSGTVAEILVDNSQPVEFGSRLLRIT